jgi:hypothetical protein
MNKKLIVSGLLNLFEEKRFSLPETPLLISHPKFIHLFHSVSDLLFSFSEPMLRFSLMPSPPSHFLLDTLTTNISAGK